jgi:hypothetical protein
LKYFLNQSYANALENMEILNLKHTQYAIFTLDKKVISWYNEQTLNVFVFDGVVEMEVGNSVF